MAMDDVFMCCQFLCAAIVLVPLVLFALRRFQYARPSFADAPIELLEWEQDLARMAAANSAVSCGENFAPNCSMCSPASCFDDCVWLSAARGCVPIVADEQDEPPFAGRALHFEPARHTLRVVETSPLSAAALLLLLDGARHGHAAAAAAASQTDLDVPHLVHTARSLPTRHDVKLGVNGMASHVQNVSATTLGSPPWHVALLRDPLEIVEAELMPHPELCRPARSDDGQCSEEALDELRGGTDTARVQTTRFGKLVLCCANPLSRSLIATMPDTEATRRCLRVRSISASSISASSISASHGASPSSACDDGTMHALARRALLRLPWFGLLNAPTASLAVLERSMGIRTPQLDYRTQRAMGHAAWPWRPKQLTRTKALSPAQARAWRQASAVDVGIYELAAGVLAFRARVLSIPEVQPRAMRRWLPVARPDLNSVDEMQRVNASRIFATRHGPPARPVSAVAPPLVFRARYDTLVFLHIAKCGGTSFNRRLMSLDTDVPCACRPPDNGTVKLHNGHPIVQARGCSCPRVPRSEFHLGWSKLAMQKLDVRGRRQWAFLQSQWLVSPETSGWLGGVHAPVRVMQTFMMLSARLTSNAQLSHGLHYVTLLRQPIRRFLSEFYETYDGWEASFGTPPRVNKSHSCSSRLPPWLRERAEGGGIDVTTKEKYDELFPYWLDCPMNMAASRQTRTLSYASVITG